MTTSLHMVGARAIAMTNGIEERAKATYAGGKAYSIVTDQLGTPTEAYNAEGEEVWSRRLDMNGNILEENYDLYAPYSEQIRIPFLFQGQYYDYETELAYNRFRYYSPELGRYISEDPIGLEGSIDLFAYVFDPVSGVDVFGLLRRPYIRKGTRAIIESNAKIVDQRFIDPHTRKPIEGGKRRPESIASGMYDLGHKKGHEHWRLVKIAENRGYSQKQFNDWVNQHPEWFQIEDPSENRSRRHEKKKKPGYKK